MNNINFKITGICLVMFLASCSTDRIQPEELSAYQNKMVINGVVSANENISIELTDSKAAIDSTLPKLIKDAVATLLTVDQDYTMVYNDFTERYESTVQVNSEESVNLRITHPNFPNITSTVRVPDAPYGSASLTVDGAEDSLGFPVDLLELSFIDPGGLQNYYKLNMYYLNPTLNEWVPLIFDKTDPSLSGYSSFLLDDGGVIFTDDLFDGKTKSLSTLTPFGITTGNTGDKYRIDFAHVSRDLYKYYKTIQRAKDARNASFNGGYNNAVVIHSNIDNGLGILGAQTKISLILK